MKFWKQILLTVSMLIAIVGVGMFTSCEKNACDGVTCQNGGACGHGLCNCPTGYEGAQCETKKIDRYLGTYAGYTTCNSGTHIIDTVIVTPANRGILSVDVYYKGIHPKVLKGYVNSNESTYEIIINNNDSSKDNATFYQRLFTVTLQSDKSLKLHTYEIERTTVMDTIINKCEFLGVKLIKKK